MTIQDLGSIGELLAAIATIATLGYLAVQIRQNTRAVRASSHHAVTDSFNHINMTLGSDPALARIFRLGNQGLDQLTDDEQVVFSFLHLSVFRVFETLYYQREVGTAEEQLFQSEIRSLDSVASNPGVRTWWSSNPYAFSPEFRRFVETRMQAVDSLTAQESGAVDSA